MINIIISSTTAVYYDTHVIDRYATINSNYCGLERREMVIFKALLISTGLPLVNSLILWPIMKFSIDLVALHMCIRDHHKFCLYSESPYSIVYKLKRLKLRLITNVGVKLVQCCLHSQCSAVHFIAIMLQQEEGFVYTCRIQRLTYCAATFSGTIQVGGVS